MQKIYLAVLLGTFILGGCKKDEKSSTIVADFAFDSQNSTSVIVPEANVFTFQNLSQNATSYSWDLGNGQTSTEKQPTTTYTDAGIYNVVLTAKASNGLTATSKKTIKVVAPVMKTISIENLTLGSDVFHVPVLAKADIWVEVKVKDKSTADVLLSNGTIKRDIFYKTTVYPNAVTGNAAIIFDVVGKKLLSHNLTDKNYAIELYAKSNGNTYLLYSSDYFSATFTGDIKANNFVWSGHVNTRVTVTGSYE